MHTELDSLHHGPGWVPRAEFLDEVAVLAAAPQAVERKRRGTAAHVLDRPRPRRAHPDVVVVRLRGTRDVERWVAGPLASALR